jgi:23S rRNA pseudouridine2605 synthase
MYKDISYLCTLILLVMNTKNTGRSTTSKTGKPKSNAGKSPVKAKAPVSKTGKPGQKLTGKALKAKSKFVDFKDKQKKGDPLPTFNEDAIRLNKYLSNAGICSRREADVLIATGVVSVNGEIITELGYKIGPTDVIKYDGQTIRTEVKRYVLLNKPKGFITTSDDPFGRKTVMSLVKKACIRLVVWIKKQQDCCCLPTMVIWLKN